MFLTYGDKLRRRNVKGVLVMSSHVHLARMRLEPRLRV